MQRWPDGMQTWPGSDAAGECNSGQMQSRSCGSRGVTLTRAIHEDRLFEEVPQVVSTLPRLMLPSHKQEDPGQATAVQASSRQGLCKPTLQEPRKKLACRSRTADLSMCKTRQGQTWPCSNQTFEKTAGTHGNAMSSPSLGQNFSAICCW